jgi:hypothetical protein
MTGRKKVTTPIAFEDVNETKIILPPANEHLFADLLVSFSILANELYRIDAAEVPVSLEEAKGTVYSHLFRYGTWDKSWNERITRPMTDKKKLNRTITAVSWVRTSRYNVLGGNTWLRNHVAGTLCREALVVTIGNCYLQARHHEFEEFEAETEQETAVRKAKVAKFDNLVQLHKDACDAATAKAVYDARLDLENPENTEMQRLLKTRALAHYSKLQSQGISHPFEGYIFVSRAEI